MIFIGGGSLLWRAVRSAANSGHSVDLVCVRPEETCPDGFPIAEVDDVNSVAAMIEAACSDDVVWSINNPSILRAPVLDLGLRIYNIHNGPLPAYRGLPEIAITHALLNDETHYAATLHEVDRGIDTGAVLDVEEFPISPQDRFQEVMLTGLRACHTLFERNLDLAVSATLTPVDSPSSSGGYYGRARLKELASHRGNPGFERAANLGVFTHLYPELAAALAVPATTESVHS
ncbi:formyltransferase family protein [Rhodococcus sp. NPDC049939]|uniref:formyltransferase family protein n=1 Tax=Rhodococcus sp. NPDC049939 TaxID=3155511 RepID=UPI00340E87D4